MSRRRSNLSVAPDVMETLYTTMRRIRAFEERTGELFGEGLIKGTAHLYIGQEAVAAGVCANLRDDDYVASTHRGHGHCIAKGAKIERMMAELMGRDTGTSRGLGGSMHIADMDLNIFGANGIVGASLPIATGAALAAKMRGEGQVAVPFFGDGAVNQGVFHEALNLAAVWALPVVFVCENNAYALTTRSDATTAGEGIARRAAAYGIPGITVDGNDAVEVYLVVRDAVARARAGEGPTLIEAMTYRWGGHSLRTELPEVRPKAERRAWIARDPIKQLEKRLLEGGGVAKKRVGEIGAAATSELDAAVEFAQKSPEPSAETMFGAVGAAHDTPAEPGPGEGRELGFVEALNEALHQEMARDRDVVVLGEDVAETGGLFGATKGLAGAFGTERVRDTPISEAGFVGCGLGAAVAGLRPVVEIQIFDFIALTMDMIVNQAAKFRYMQGGGPAVPLVVRGPQGGGIRLAAQHSQSLEAWFTHVPGLVVIAPSTPYEAKGLLVAAIRDDNPVIFLEQKLLYIGPGGPVPEELYAVPIGKARIRREGADVTVVATSSMVSRALGAATQLERDGISVEVIDPRTLKPLDEEAILASVRKTNRMVIVHEGWKCGGFGAEVCAMVVEKAFDDLDAPIQRLGAADVPMPYNDSLERSVIPSQEAIVAAIRAL